MSDLIERSAALRVIFDSVGRPATEIYQEVRELPAAENPYPSLREGLSLEKPGYAEAALEIQREIVCLDRTAEVCKQMIIKYLLNRAKEAE